MTDNTCRWSKEIADFAAISELDGLLPQDAFLARMILSIQGFVRNTRANTDFLDWSVEQIIAYASEGRRGPIMPKPVAPRVRLKHVPLDVERAIGAELLSGVRMNAIAKRLNVSMAVVRMAKQQIEAKKRNRLGR